MQTPSASAMLGAWERGSGRGVVERGLELLTLACPGEACDALAALSIGERDRLLLELRQALFGPRMTGLVSCSSCGERLEFEFDAADLRIPATATAAALRQDGLELELRLPDSRDLLACAAAGETDAPMLLLRRCVLSARLDGAPLDAAALPPEVVDQAARRLIEADPQADLRFKLDCAGCGQQWMAPFDVVRFLWTELEAWAVRMLQEVHTLASAYGWAERDILALDGTRRRQYLRLIRA
jgi:hypothetical protein